MRNKVNSNIAARMIAMLLTLVMILGTFSVAVFAEEASAGDAKPAVAADNTDSAGTAEVIKEGEQTEKSEPEEVPEKSEEEAVSAEEPVKTEKTAELEKVPEKTEEPADSSGNEPAARAAAPAGAAASENGNRALKAAAATPEPAKESGTAANNSGTTTNNEETSYEVKIVSGAVTAKVNGVAISSGDKIKANETVSLSTTAAEGTYEFRVNGASSGNSFAMPAAPVSIDIAYKVTLKAGDIPDGVTVTFNAGSGNTTYKFPDETSFYLAAGTELIVGLVEGLTSEFQQGNSPANGKKQLKLVFNDEGKEFRISLNNSDLMKNQQSGRTNTNAVYTMPARAVEAVFRIAYRIRYIPAEEPYNHGSCSINNNSDTTSELGDMFALPGDKISVNYDASNYESVDLAVSDNSGNQVPVSGGQFTMPSSMANLTIAYYHRPVAVNVINLKPERGKIYTKLSEYRPGETVVVYFRANSGYKLNSKTLMYTYKLNGQMYVEKIEKGSNGKYSFVMPFYPIDIRGTFVSKESYESASDPSLYIDYSVEDEENAEEAEAQAQSDEAEEVTPELFDVTPIVAAVIAETVMTATVHTTSLTH